MEKKTSSKLTILVSIGLAIGGRFCYNTPVTNNNTKANKMTHYNVTYNRPSGRFAGTQETALCVPASRVRKLTGRYVIRLNAAFPAVTVVFMTAVVPPTQDAITCSGRYGSE